MALKMTTDLQTLVSRTVCCASSCTPEALAASTSCKASECEVVVELLRRCVEENAHSALDQQEYQQRYLSLVERYEADKDGLKKIDDKRLERNAKRDSIGTFIRTLEENDKLMSEFDEGLWITTVDTVVVYPEHEITFTFRDGLELDWKI